MAWATVDTFAAYLRRDVDAAMPSALAAAVAWANRHRPDLDPAAYPAGAEIPEDDDTATNAPADVTHAVHLYAALLWREAVAPSGFATFTDLDDGTPDTGTVMANVYRLLGTRRPVAR